MKQTMAYYNFRNQLSEKESEIRHKVKDKEQVEHMLAAIKDRLNELKLHLAGMKERLDVEFRITLTIFLAKNDQDRCLLKNCRKRLTR